MEDKEEHDITEASMPSKTWSSDEDATIKIPVPITTKKYYQVKDPTVAPKAHSPDSTTTIPADRTACPVSESNYEAPSVEDCSDDNLESDPLPKLPDDSKWVLDLEDDLDNDNSSEGNVTESEQDSTEDSIPQTIPLNQARPIDTEESSGTDCTDEESEYESDTDSDAEREDAVTPPHPVEDTPKEYAKSAIMVECKRCGLSYEWKGRNIQRLPCQHYMCHVCLLQYLALSLISPKYMSARCCDSPKGEINRESFRNIVIDSRIGTAWEKYELLRNHDDWRCPRGHPPKGGSLTVTAGSRNSPPIWKEVVNCSGCLTQTRLIDGSVKEVRPTSFCLLCLGEVSGNVCNQCEQNSVVWPFITNLQERIDAPTSWLSSVLKFACRDRLMIRNGSSQLQFQTLAHLKGLPSPDEGQSESEAEHTKSDANGDSTNTEQPESQTPSPGPEAVPPEQPESSTARTSHSEVRSETNSPRSRSRRKKNSHDRRRSPKPTRARILWEKITPQVFHSQPKKKKKR